MGFRNPLTSLRADQITPGTLGPAVVTQSIATATSGRRVVMSADPARRQGVEFYTGRPGEVVPGEVSVQVTDQGAGFERPELRLRSPVVSDTGVGMLAEIRLIGSSRTPGVYPAHIDVAAGTMFIAPTTTVAAPVQLLGQTWQNLPLNPNVPWAPYTTNMQPKCRKDAAGRVQVDGLVAGGWFQTTICTLPEGYRPIWWTITSALVSIDGVEKQIRVDVFPDGRIVCGAGTGTTIGYLSLAAISFPTF